MNESIQKKEMDRFAFLKLLYEIADSQPSPFIDGEKIGKELGFDIDATRRICKYLDEEGLIRIISSNAEIVEITHQGIKEVEFILRHPAESSEHFPSWNVIINHGVMQAQIVTGENNLTYQSQLLDQKDIDTNELAQILNQILTRISEISSEAQTQSRIAAEIESVLVLAKSPLPDQSHIRNLTKRLVNILTSIGTDVAAEFAKKLLT
jgi:hypothetical protein